MNFSYQLARAWAYALNALPKGGRRTAILIMGQSNATNVTQGDPTWVSNRGVLQLNGTQIYPAYDPLAAVSGDGTSFIVRLGDILVTRRPGPLIMASVAVGSTTIASWKNSLYTRGLTVRDFLASQNILLESILWMQGEADGPIGTPSAEYTSALVEIAGHFPGFPFYVPILSWSGGVPYPNVQDGQRAARYVGTIKAGPNLDMLNNSYRMDGTHFNVAGCQRAAEMWANAL